MSVQAHDNSGVTEGQALCKDVGGIEDSHELVAKTFGVESQGFSVVAAFVSCRSRSGCQR